MSTGYRQHQHGFYRDYVKRGLDFCIALIALIILSPLLLIVYLLLCIANGKSGAFFFQERPGKDARIFRIVKFKTISDRCDADGNLLPGADRITPIARFVRLTSIDELPLLWNVLRGDMSFIGPRPLLPQYLPLYNNVQARRHEVRPGITGWAQRHGRNAISWPKKFELDVWYVDHVLLSTDIQIIWLTIQKVLRRADINEAGQATMEAFNRNN